MKDILIDMGISALFTELKAMVHNPDNKRKMKNVFLKIYKQIKTAYSDDADFQ